MGLSSKIFSDNPKAGNAIYIICDRLPADTSDMFFYATCGNHNRNEFEEKKRDLFAKIKWECYTSEGFVEMNSVDYTGGFLVDGEIRLKMPKDSQPEVYEKMPIVGYCIRGTLSEAHYDIAPSLVSLDSFLFEAWQRQTKSFVKTAKKQNAMTVEGLAARENYITIFVREEKGGPYYIYTQAPMEGQGRFFDMKESEAGITYKFDKEKYGFGPEKGRDSIRALLYDEQTMRNFNLGKVLGYDNQIIDLPYKNVVKESISLIAKYDEGPDTVYEFVRAGHDGDTELDYTIDEQNGKLCIRNAGKYIGAELLIGSCAITKGADGNVRAKNIFKAHGLPQNLVFTNPQPSTGGRSRESLAELKKRFLDDIDSPAVAVSEQDYEALVLSTPGLCIRKAKAIEDSAKNQVKITALVDDGTDMPKLSEDYKQIILERINAHRLLCTRVTIINPVYVPINLAATVYVKPHFEDKKSEIEAMLKEFLNYVDSENRFGDVLRYEDVFRKIEDLSYVAYVYDLRLAFAKANQGTTKDQDIVPIPSGLIVPGNMSIELITYYES